VGVKDSPTWTLKSYFGATLEASVWLYPAIGKLEDQWPVAQSSGRCEIEHLRYDLAPGGFDDSKNRVCFANTGVARTLHAHLNWRMKARCSRHNETQLGPVDTGDKGPLDWQLLSGLSLADIGLLVVGFAGLDAATAGAQSLLYSVGGTLCLVGLVLIWMGTSNLSAAAWPKVATNQACSRFGPGADFIIRPRSIASSPGRCMVRTRKLIGTLELLIARRRKQINKRTAMANWGVTRSRPSPNLVKRKETGARNLYDRTSTSRQT
jgi:hypothetical protein